MKFEELTTHNIQNNFLQKFKMANDWNERKVAQFWNSRWRMTEMRERWHNFEIQDGEWLKWEKGGTILKLKMANDWNERKVAQFWNSQEAPYEPCLMITSPAEWLTGNIASNMSLFKISKHNIIFVYWAICDIPHMLQSKYRLYEIRPTGPARRLATR